MFCRVMGERKIVFFILVQGIMFTKHASCTIRLSLRREKILGLMAMSLNSFYRPVLCHAITGASETPGVFQQTSESYPR